MQQYKDLKVEHSSQPKNFKEWKCSSCGKRLGVLDKEHKILRLKSKDWYVYVQGGTVVVICRGCAQWNKIQDSNVEEDFEPME